ncbi:MAG TPA: hypothetical protein VFB14_15010 [Bryobacteraceae bacterium]|nr:hypothetical protein [Bryobacteraceae bacterium]
MNAALRIACLFSLGFFLLQPTPGFAFQNGSQPPNAHAGTAHTAKKSSARTAPSAQEIADAKSKGLVWVNLSTHVYHKEGPNYGTTKRGKFMTEEDARKAGYRPANEGNSSKKSSAPANTPK